MPPLFGGESVASKHEHLRRSHSPAPLLPQASCGRRGARNADHPVVRCRPASAAPIHCRRGCVLRAGWSDDPQAETDRSRSESLAAREAESEREHIRHVAQEAAGVPGDVEPGENFLYVFKPSPAGDGPDCAGRHARPLPPPTAPGGRAPEGPPAMRRQGEAVRRSEVIPAGRRSCQRARTASTPLRARSRQWSTLSQNAQRGRGPVAGSGVPG